MATPISPFLTHVCDLYLCLGSQGDGDPLIDTVPYVNTPCRHSATRRTVKGFMGSDDVVRGRALFFIDGDFPKEIRNRSKIVYSGENYEVIEAAKFSTENNEEVHHWELLCR